MDLCIFFVDPVLKGKPLSNSEGALAISSSTTTWWAKSRLEERHMPSVSSFYTAVRETHIPSLFPFRKPFLPQHVTLRRAAFQVWNFSLLEQKLLSNTRHVQFEHVERQPSSHIHLVLVLLATVSLGTKLVFCCYSSHLLPPPFELDISFWVLEEHWIKLWY